MSDSNPLDHDQHPSPRDSGVLPTEQERQAQEEWLQKRSEKEADDAYKKRQIDAAEAANELAKSNRNLQVAVILLTMVTAGATLYQGHLNRKSWEVARDTLTQIKSDSESSSRQFQVQLGRYDASLGMTQLLALHAGEQSISGEKSATAASRIADNTVAVQRPWIGVSLQLTRVLRTDNGYQLSIAPTLMNIGNGVASDVIMNIETRIPSSDQNIPPKEPLHKFCDIGLMD